MAREVRCHQTDRRKDGWTDGRTDTQTDYSNPRCACAPRVNNSNINKKSQPNYTYSMGDLMPSICICKLYIHTVVHTFYREITFNEIE